MGSHDQQDSRPRVTDVARAVAAGAMAGAAMIHFAHAPPHFDESASHGTFFVVVGWLQLVLAAGLALRLRPERIWLAVTAGANTGIVLLWILSRTAGLPGEDAEPAGFPDILASVLEGVAVLAALALLFNLLVDRTVPQRPVLGVGAVAALATMALVSLSVAPSFAGEHDHGEGDGHDHETLATGHMHDDDEDSDSHGHDLRQDDHDDEHADSDDHDSDDHDDGHDSDDDGHDSDGHDDGHDSDDDDGHGHGTTPTTHRPGDPPHNHDPGPGPGDPPHSHGPDPTTPPGHEHPPGEDWATIRMKALTGHLPADKIAEFRQKAIDHLSGEILARSDVLAELPEAEREARLQAFVLWSVDHALEAENGHSHGPVPWKPITDPAQQVELQNQLAAAGTVIPQYPTAADARAAGYRQVTPYIPGIAAHYIKLGLVDRTFDPAAPEMLLYNGNEPTSVLVGVSYAMFGETPGPNDGFVGDNDSWHEHPSLCLLGAFVIGADHTPADLCESVGASKSNIRLHMSHLWQVPGWESAWGLFSGENPAVNMATSDLMRD